VEAGFDGDLQELKKQLEKGYHLESVDGRKHTALSEAACQGHVEVMKYLLEIGADPNSVSDTGRSPLWRAAFNGHTEVQYSVQIFFQKLFGVCCW
jgi:ankyrin repeat protein